MARLFVVRDWIVTWDGDGPRICCPTSAKQTRAPRQIALSQKQSRQQRYLTTEAFNTLTVRGGKIPHMWKFAIAIGLTAVVVWGQEETPDKRLRHSADVLSEIMSAPDKGIPHNLFDRARCIIIVPGLKKGAFVFGADYGRGFAACRSGDSWTGPAAVRIGGGSFGAQLGLESTDVVVLVMNQKGMDRLAGDKFTIGADASGAIGPIGRTVSADTDARMTAEMLSWSRAKGIFAGVSLDGTTITPDHGEDRKVYGRDVSNHAILKGEVKPPEAGNALIMVLNKFARQGTAPAAH